VSADASDAPNTQLGIDASTLDGVALTLMMLRTFQRIAPATVAALTILAMLLAPVCGTVCAAPNHCAAPEPALVQAESQDCHHSLIPGNSDAAAAAVTSTRNCARPEILALTVDYSKSWSASRSSQTSLLPVSAIVVAQSCDFSAALRRAPFLDSNCVHRSATPLARSTVLQI
jgi:hypothetical protein